MGDALCGPSNPLQNLRKHTSTDRTLQQDRLVSRQGPGSQGFRSSPGPNAGILDREFEAFQAGFGPAFPGPDQFQHAPSSFSPAPTQFQAQQQAVPSWARDFQRLNISQPRPGSVVQQHPAPQSQQVNGWHQDFLRQQQPPVQQPALQAQYQSRLGHLAQLSPPAQSSYYQPNFQSPIATESAQKGKERFVEDRYDADAFERAFEERYAELQRLEGEAELARTVTLARNHSMGQDVALMDDGSTLEDIYARIDQLQQEADKLREVEAAQLLKSQEMEKENETMAPEQGHSYKDKITQDEELAHTAGELLERVADNHSEKFQNSNFLALMRQFRDYEVRVEGNKVVETGVSTERLIDDTTIVMRRYCPPSD